MVCYKLMTWQQVVRYCGYNLRPKQQGCHAGYFPAVSQSSHVPCSSVVTAPTTGRVSRVAL